jgi:hypothetical protein
MNAAQATVEELPMLGGTGPASDRERLLLAVVELCDRANRNGELDAGRAEVNVLLQDVFLNLVSSAERRPRGIAWPNALAVPAGPLTDW